VVNDDAALKGGDHGCLQARLAGRVHDDQAGRDRRSGGYDRKLKPRQWDCPQ
jgi:hypothetical protein